MTLVQSDSKKRTLGALIGLAVGDALGAPVEFRRRNSFLEIKEMLGGGKFKLPPGAWTDDTAMALCLAESLLQDHTLNLHDLMSRFLGWIDRGENSSTGRAVGLGQNILWALGNFRKTGQLVADLRARPAHSNGSLMRLAPIPCMYWRDPKQAMKLASVQSWATHHSALASAVCIYATRLMCALISGDTWADARAVAQADVMLEQSPELSSLLERDLTARSRDEISSSGYVIHTLEAALWSIETTNSFEDALIRAVNLGDDADTVGAVTGQLAGALYGVNDIPHAWLDALVDVERIMSLGAELFEAHAT